MPKHFARLAGTWSLLRDVAMRVGRANLALSAAGVAFFALFALFPALGALIAIFGLWADPGLVLDQFQLLKGVIPDPAFDLFSDQLDKLLFAGYTRLTTATILSTLVALWSARAGVAALIGGLNAAYGTPMRGGLRHMAVAVILTLALVVVATVALSMMIVVPVIYSAASQIVDFHVAATRAIETARWGVSLLIMVSGLGILYRYGPNRRGARPGWFTWGAVFAILGWFAASALFSVYIANFGRYNEVYGSIGAVIAVQMWMYLSALLILIGAAINAEIDARRRGI